MLSLMVSVLEVSAAGETIAEKLLRKIRLRPEVINESTKHHTSIFLNLQYNKTKAAY